MGSLKVDFYKIVKNDIPVTTTSDTLVDDPYAYVEIYLNEPRTVLVVYQTTNNYGYSQEYIGRGSAINVDGVDVALSWDSPADDNYPCRNVSVWVGTLGSGNHVIRGRFNSVEQGYISTISSRVLIVMVFKGDAYYYVEDDTDVSTSSENLQDDPYAQVTLNTRQDDVVLAIYNVTSESNILIQDAVDNAVNVDGADYSLSGKIGFGFDSPLSSISVYAGRHTGGQVTVKGRMASASEGKTITVSRRQMAVLVLDGSLTETDYLYVERLFSTESTKPVDDPYAEVTKNIVGHSKILFLAVVGFKGYDLPEPTRGFGYGVAIDGRDVYMTYTSNGFLTGDDSAPSFYTMVMGVGQHTIKGKVVSIYKPTDYYKLAYITHRYVVAVWLTVFVEDVSVYDNLTHSMMPLPGLTVDGYVVPSYIDEWGRFRINSILEDGTFLFLFRPPLVIHEVYDSITAVDTTLLHRTIGIHDFAHISDTALLMKTLDVLDGIVVVDVLPLVTKLFIVLDILTTIDGVLLNKALSKVFDSIQLFDVPILNKLLATTDPIIIIDTTNLYKQSFLIDVLTLDDIVTIPYKILTISDLSISVDTISFYKQLLLEDIFTLTDVITRPFKVLNITDLTSLLDSIISHKMFYSIDTFALTDAVVTPYKTSIITDLIDLVDKVLRPYRFLLEVETLSSMDAISIPIRIIPELDTIVVTDKVTRSPRILTELDNISLLDVGYTSKELVLVDLLKLLEEIERWIWIPRSIILLIDGVAIQVSRAFVIIDGVAIQISRK